MREARQNEFGRRDGPVGTHPRKEKGMRKGLRLLMAAMTTTLFALATNPSDALAEKEKTDCTDHCAERAARYCEDLENLSLIHI